MLTKESSPPYPNLSPTGFCRAGAPNLDVRAVFMTISAKGNTMPSTTSCTLVVMTCCRILAGVETWETRLYVTSHGIKAQALSDAIRKHWGIENGQHWRLDVTFALFLGSCYASREMRAQAHPGPHVSVDHRRLNALVSE